MDLPSGFESKRCDDIRAVEANALGDCELPRQKTADHYTRLLYIMNSQNSSHVTPEGNEADAIIDQ